MTKEETCVEINAVKHNAFSPNMATTPNPDPLAEKIIPNEFSRNMDLQRFIKQCERYFLVKGTSEKAQENAMFCLLDVDLHKEYEATEGKASGFKARLMMAFEEPKDVIQDMKSLLNYRKRGDKAGIFIEKVERLVENLLAHELTKEKLTALFLIHASDSKEVEEEAIMKNVENVDDIKEMIKRREKAEEKFRARHEINAVRSYAETTKDHPRRKTSQRKDSDFQRKIRCFNCNRVGHMARECRERKRIVCYSCQKEGHIAKECTRRPTPECYACGKIGHIQRECNVVQCNRCNKRGHKSEDCYTKRRNERYDDTPRRFNRQGRGRVNAVEEGIYDDDGSDDQRSEEGERINSVHEDYRQHPKGRAPLGGEMVGAIN